MIHAEIQPEDELTVTDRAIVDRVRGLSHIPRMYTPNQLLISANTYTKYYMITRMWTCLMPHV